MNSNLGVYVLAVAVLAMAGAVFLKSETALGAGVSQDVYFPQYFNAGLVEAGITSTSTTGTVVLPFTAFDEEKVVRVIPTGATTLTFPASSTMAGFIPTPGMTKSFIVHQAGTSTNAITFAGGTGTLLKRATTSSAIAGDADGGNFAEVTMTRLFNGNFAVGVRSYTD